MQLKYLAVGAAALLAWPFQVSAEDCKGFVEAYHNNTACDSNCAHRILYRVAYSSGSSGMRQAMHAYDAFDWCTSDSSKDWCPDAISVELSAIAGQTIKDLTIDFNNCDAECLLLSMSTVSDEAGLAAMQWANSTFADIGTHRDELKIQELQDDIADLSKHQPLNIDICALGWPADHVPKSHKQHKNKDKDLAIGLPFLAAPGVLLGPFLLGGLCKTDLILCEGEKFEYLFNLMDRIIDRGRTLLGRPSHFVELLEEEALEEIEPWMQIYLEWWSPINSAAPDGAPEPEHPDGPDDSNGPDGPDEPPPADEPPQSENDDDDLYNDSGDEGDHSEDEDGPPADEDDPPEVPPEHHESGPQQPPPNEVPPSPPPQGPPQPPPLEPERLFRIEEYDVFQERNVQKTFREITEPDRVKQLPARPGHQGNYKAFDQLDEEGRVIKKNVWREASRLKPMEGEWSKVGNQFIKMQDGVPQLDGMGEPLMASEAGTMLTVAPESIGPGGAPTYRTFGARGQPLSGGSPVPVSAPSVPGPPGAPPIAPPFSVNIPAPNGVVPQLSMPQIGFPGLHFWGHHDHDSHHKDKHQDEHHDKDKHQGHDKDSKHHATSTTFKTSTVSHYTKTHHSKTPHTETHDAKTYHTKTTSTNSSPMSTTTPIPTPPTSISEMPDYCMITGDKLHELDDHKRHECEDFISRLSREDSMAWVATLSTPECLIDEYTWVLVDKYGQKANEKDCNWLRHDLTDGEKKRWIAGTLLPDCPYDFDHPKESKEHDMNSDKEKTCGDLVMQLVEIVDYD